MSSLIPTSAFSTLASLAGSAASYVAGAAANHPYIALGMAGTGAGVAAYRTGMISSLFSSITTSAVSAVTTSAKNAAKHQAYKALSQYITSSEQEIRTNQPELIEDRSNGLYALFEKNREFQGILNSATSTQATIDRQFDVLFEKITSAKFYIHGASLNPAAQPAAPSIEELEALHRAAVQPQAAQAAPLEQNDETLNRELHLELKKFTTCLRRKLEIQSILGDAASQDLNNTINGASEEAFQNEFKKAIWQSIERSSTPQFLRKIRYAWVICGKFFLGIITKSLLNKVNKFLDKSLKEFVSQDKTKIMDLITNVLCSGLHLYTNEVINAAHELRDKTQVNGTPDMMFEDILSKKTTLHKGMSQKDFYMHTLDQLLKYCFDWSITRWAVKQIVKASGFLNNPFLTLPQNIKHANGYFYNIDKAIVRFINPIIQKMSLSGPDAEEGAAAEAASERKFSNINKDTLKRSIESLFEATEIYRAPNLSEIKKIVARSDKSDREQTILESLDLNTDAILKQTAEAGAKSLLENIAKVLDSKFLKENAISSLKSINAAFSSSETITDLQYQAAERERKEALNRLTQVIITNAVDSAPILNTTEIVGQLNTEITRSKALALHIQERLTTHTATGRGIDEVAIYPRELLDQILQDITELKRELDLAVDSGRYSDDQIQDIFAPYHEIKAQVANFQKAFITPQGQAPRANDVIASEARSCVRNLHTAINSPVFAIRTNCSVMNNPKVKAITKFVLNFMLRQKFNHAYEFICDFKTIKYCVIHQGVAQAL
jgi:hypothetical protein